MLMFILYVSPEISFLSRSIGAKPACKGLFTRVRTHVVLQIGSGDGGVVTEGTSKLVVRTHVVLQIASSDGGVVTEGTSILVVVS